MIQFIKKSLPHLSVALGIAIMFILYLDARNPMMGFLEGNYFTVLCAVNLAVSILLSISLTASRFSQKQKQDMTE